MNFLAPQILNPFDVFFVKTLKNKKSANHLYLNLIWLKTKETKNLEVFSFNLLNSSEILVMIRIFSPAYIDDI
jgi:hypothetical protein